MQGYASEEYARSLAEFGSPLALPAAGGWLLARELPGYVGRDAAGCYPLFCCANWSELAEDLAQLPADVVSVSLVADPASNWSAEQLRACFPDVCYPYKVHYFADLSQPLASFVADNHQRNVRQAARRLRVQRLMEPLEELATWNSLYAGLIRRHGITGIAAFSPATFARQLCVPGLRAYAALAGEEIVGMILWFVADGVAHYHLAAYSDVGYEHKASFLLFWHCLEAFAAEGVAWAALGGGAGTFSASEGLARFKQGWSSESRPAYFCGRILDAARYAQLVRQSGCEAGSYFPAYRAPALTRAA